MNSDANRPRIEIGAVPGSLRKHGFASESRVRLIEYSAKHHVEELLTGEVHVRERLSLASYSPRSRGVDDTIVASPIHASGDSDEKEKKARTVTWLNVDGLADIDLIKALGKKYGLHALALEDVVDVNQYAKTDSYADIIFIVLRMPRETQPFSTEQVSMFLLDGVVLTFQEYAGDCLDPVRERISKSKGRVRSRDADYLAYAIIDAIIDGFFPVVDAYDIQLSQINSEIDEDLPRDIPRRLHAIRADLLNIRRVAQQHQDAISMLLRDESEIISDRTMPFLRDCLDHINRLVQTADAYRETCGELRELYFAQIGQKTNDVMKVLTIVATTFIPMSFIAGVYGMNFDSNASSMNMPELQWAFGYPFAVVLMVCTGGGLLLYLRRQRWL